MREVALFGEDYAHQQVIGGLAQRLAKENGVEAHWNWRNAQGGHGQVIHEFRVYLRDLAKHNTVLPDLIIVATDANCSGLNNRIGEINRAAASVPAPLPPIIPAVPDPHIERWLLLDGAAFRRVLGIGCDAPEQKCSRNLYKQRLTQAVLDTGIEPSLGGIEFAQDIVREMDLERAKRADQSLQSFLDGLARQFRLWTP